MEKKQRDLNWKCLPKGTRDFIKCQLEAKSDCQEFDEGYDQALIDLFGKPNLESNTEPEEMLMAKASEVKALYKNSQLFKEYKETEPTGELIESWLIKLFGDKCLPDPIVLNVPSGGGGMSTTPPAYKLDVETDKELEHRLEQTSVQVEPKFKVGQMVAVKKVGMIGNVKSYDSERSVYCICFKSEDDERDFEYKESELEPYTEPETKDNMEEKELNLCELLKGCEGEEIFSTFEGNMTITKVTDSNIVLHGHNTDLHCGNGFYPSGICQLYPSRALYEKYPLGAKKAWDEWASERKPKRWIPQIGERIFWVNSHGTVSQDVCRSDIEGNGHQLKRRVIGNEFKTGKEAEQAAEAVRECLEKFHKEHQ